MAWCKESACNAGAAGNAITGSGRTPGEGHGNLLQYSCLENPMDRGAWQATVHRVAKSRTWLKRHAQYRNSQLKVSAKIEDAKFNQNVKNMVTLYQIKEAGRTIWGASPVKLDQAATMSFMSGDEQMRGTGVTEATDLAMGWTWDWEQRKKWKMGFLMSKMRLGLAAGSWCYSRLISQGTRQSCSFRRKMKKHIEGIQNPNQWGN